MGSLPGIDTIALRPVLVALALGGATLVLLIRVATMRRRPARVALRRQPPGRAAAMATLEAVYVRGDITREDYLELSRRLRAR